MIIDCILTYFSINSYVERAKIAFEYKIQTESNNIMTNEVMKFVFPNMLYEKDINNKILMSKLLK